MQALENNRLFYFGDMEELYWNNMGLEMEKSTFTRSPYTMWLAVQKWKAISLVDIISQSLGQTVRPQDLTSSADEGLDVQPKTQRLAQLMKDATVTPTFNKDSVRSMAENAEQHLGDGESIIFVDWCRYYDTLFILAFNGVSGALRKGIIEYDYSKIQEWVAQNLGVSSVQEGRTSRKRLMKSSKLNELKPILEPLNGFVRENDTLVFCPSGILHAVPLQAIPFGPKGRPLIASNPVVFCASLSLLESCISRASSSNTKKPFTAAAFTRLGPEDPIEEERMRETAEKAMNYMGDGTCLTSGREVTRQMFLQRSKAVNLLHYHGHAYLEASDRKDRALVLEPVPPDDGLFSVMDLFELQLDSAVVMLLACASGEEDVAPNDDPLGLLSAFMYAGASSVIATLWPTQTSDARDFCERVYKNAFGGSGSGSGILAKAVQKAVVEMWEEWDEDEPYHWAQFQLRKCSVVYMIFFLKQHRRDLAHRCRRSLVLQIAESVLNLSSRYVEDAVPL
jgi:CHAT domain-containing protein